MPQPPSKPQYFELLSKSGLLAEPALANARKLVDDSEDAKSFALACVRNSILTKWQAERLMRGKTRFFMGNYRLNDLVEAATDRSTYLAVHNQMQRAVHLVVLQARERELIDRFLNQTRRLSSLQHPQVPQIFDFDFDGRRGYAVYEIVEGSSLAQRLAEDVDLTLEELSRFGSQIAGGVARLYENQFAYLPGTAENFSIGNDDIRFDIDGIRDTTSNNDDTTSSNNESSESASLVEVQAVRAEFVRLFSRMLLTTQDSPAWARSLCVEIHETVAKESDDPIGALKQAAKSLEAVSRKLIQQRTASQIAASSASPAYDDAPPSSDSTSQESSPIPSAFQRQRLIIVAGCLVGLIALCGVSTVAYLLGKAQKSETSTSAISESFKIDEPWWEKEQKKSRGTAPEKQADKKPKREPAKSKSNSTPSKKQANEEFDLSTVGVNNRLTNENPEMISGSNSKSGTPAKDGSGTPAKNGDDPKENDAKENDASLPGHTENDDPSASAMSEAKPAETAPFDNDAAPEPQNPFEELGLNVQLPKPKQGEAIAFTLGNCELPADATVLVSLLGNETAHRKAFQFSIKRRKKSNSTWELFMANGPKVESIAELVIRESKLMFRWRADLTNPVAAAHLQNCLVRLRYADFEHVIGLRNEPLEIDPLTISCEAETFLRKIKITALPSIREVRLEVLELSEHFDEIKIEPAIVGPKTPATIRAGTKQYKPLQFDLRLDLKRGVTLSMGPKFLNPVNEKWIPLTTSSYATAKQFVFSTHNSIPTIKEQFKNNLSRLQKKQEFAKVNWEDKKIEHKANIRRIEKAYEDIAELGRICQSLHGVAKVRVRLFFEVGERQVDLVRSRPFEASDENDEADGSTDE